jgi:hypothetical protein
MTIKKSYENCIKDIESFIDINIHGIGQYKKFKKPKKEKTVNTGDLFSMNNLSLFSNNSEFEKIFQDEKLTQKISKTLKRISK